MAMQLSLMAVNEGYHPEERRVQIASLHMLVVMVRLLVKSNNA
jgi:hypothetical protein